MSTPLSPTKLFQCDGCGATLPLDATQIGKKCRCGQCGKILVVPGFEPEEEFSAAPQAAPVPETVGFYCRVCDTRLVAHTKDVGKNAKCPDCGAKNVVPPPPKTRPKRPPRAMHGEQYGLWGVDEAPLPSELSARQPKFYPVYCRVCDTLMQAHVKLVGTNLTCPDCGAKTAVPPPPLEITRPSVLVPEGEEYQLDAESLPPPWPVTAPTSTVTSAPQPTLREELIEQYGWFGDRPKLPRVPLVTGVFRMLLRAPVYAWWLGISFFGTGAFLLGQAIESNLDGYGAIMAVFLLAAVCIVGTLLFGAVSALCCSILKDSSEGLDKLYGAPTTSVIDWFGDAFYLALAIAVSLIPGGTVGALLHRGPEGMVAGSLVFFPIFLLSMLESGSPVIIFSPRLLSSLVRRPAPWLLFYLETGLIAAGCVLAGMITSIDSVPAWLAPPLLLATVLVYFRLLGRLAWWLAELMPAEESEEEDQEK